MNILNNVFKEDYNYNVKELLKLMKKWYKFIVLMFIKLLSIQQIPNEWKSIVRDIGYGNVLFPIVIWNLFLKTIQWRT